MAEQIDIDINVNMNNVDEVDELTGKLQDATATVEELTQQLADIEMGNIDGDAEAVSEALAEAEAEAENLQEQLDGLNNTEVEVPVEVKPDGLDETNEKLQETSDTASSLGTAIGGIAGMVGVEKMISTADNINNSWNRLELTFDGTKTSIDDLKTASTQAANATGRSGGQVREYFNQMGIAGVTNTDLLSQSFQSLAGRAYQTNQPIEAMESKMQTMVLTGNAGSRMLKGLGISAEQLGQAMGVTGDEAAEAFEALDPKGRLEVLTKAMGDGATANDMYKNSYEGLKTQAETSIAGLAGAVGQGILPVINPMIQSATGLVKSFTQSFQGLPGPVQSVVGGLGGFLAVGTAAVGTLGLLGKAGSGVVGGLRSLKSGYDAVRGAMSTARAVMTALTSAESISEGVRAALAIVTGTESAAEGANAAAKTAATGPTMGLAIAENALLLPLLLVVGAIAAVVAVLYYLYNNNEMVRNAVNNLIGSIQNFIAGLIPAANSIASFIVNGIQYFMRLPVAIAGALSSALGRIGSWASSLVSRGLSAASGFVNSVRNGLSSIGSVVSSALSGVYNAFTAPFRQAYNFINDNVIKPLQNAWNSVTSLFSGFSGYSGVDETLNGTVSNVLSSDSYSSMTVNNNFNGIVEESAADYIVGAVNDRLRRERLLKGA